MPGAYLFTWLQDAAFYRDFHVAAAELMGPASGRTWLDVGTGPGLLAKIAAARGFRARGIDRDAAMIEAAERLNRERGSDAQFAVSDIETELASGRTYDIVSASSLVVVTPDPAETISKLARLTAPGGWLLIIEASAAMTRLRAIRLVASGRLGKRGYMLLPWAFARAGRTLDPKIFQQSSSGASVRHTLAHGLVDTWILEPRS